MHSRVRAHRLRAAGTVLCTPYTIHRTRRTPYTVRLTRTHCMSSGLHLVCAPAPATLCAADGDDHRERDGAGGHGRDGARHQPRAQRAHRRAHLLRERAGKSGRGLKMLLKRAFKRKDVLLLKLIRNIAAQKRAEIKMLFVVCYAALFIRVRTGTARVIAHCSFTIVGTSTSVRLDWHFSSRTLIRILLLRNTHAGWV